MARTLSVQAGVFAPKLPEGASRLIERLIAQAGPAVPYLARMVEQNLASAGVFSRDAVRLYFEQVGHHFGNAIRILGHHDDAASVARIARNDIDLHGSAVQLREALDQHGGLVLAPPHVCNYLLTLVRLNQVIPLSVYLRWSKDERRRELKERWCRAAGLRVILEPAIACDPTSRAMACVEAVREKRALVMTPDLPQKREQGIAVTLKGREVYLPSGPASIAMLANVPIAPVFGRVADGRHEIYAGESIRVPMLKREDGGRQVSIQWATQRWAEAFERFICEQPQAWFFWGDKHWSRVWHGDPRYVQPVGTTPPPTMQATSRALEACT